MRTRGEKGSSLVELSMSIMIFLVLLLGIMDFGRIVAAYNILAGATKEGARYAIVHGNASGSAASSDDIQNVVRQWAIGLDPSSVQVTATWPDGNGPRGRVQVVSTYSITPLLIWISGASFNIGSRSQMVISQ